MSLPDFILNNFRWKVVALTLAVSVWFLIQFAISRGFKPSDHPLTDIRDQTFSDLPVFVLTAPQDERMFKVTPAKVDVTIQTTVIALKRFARTDIRALVDLVDSTNIVREVREVFVQTPEGVEISRVKVKPPAVTVERVGPPP